MKSLRWENLNPTLRELLHPDSNRWSLKAVLRFIGFFIIAPLWVIGTIWAIATDTDWSRFWSGMDKLFWLLVGGTGWAFQKLRSISGTDLLLICIVLLLFRIANQNLALHEKINEWYEEWQSQQPDHGGDDFLDQG
jgi:hypothetical protein